MSFIFLILFFILFFICLAVLLVLRIFSFVIRPRRSGSSNTGQQKEPLFTFTRRQNSKKIFGKNEGEYTEFEEIKNEEKELGS